MAERWEPATHVLLILQAGLPKAIRQILFLNGPKHKIPDDNPHQGIDQNRQRTKINTSGDSLADAG